ncbi:MAG: PspC domain-containing protein [Flammeovirgaceae bacterium]|nr:PspC domain-containing protein [Flammeovirgaceae bacterium]MDW8288777.1 PspC domain-containing protein [Flammeovirgaceae bacterium]
MKLVKSEDDKMLFGVCGGLANYLGWDTTDSQSYFCARHAANSGNVYLSICSTCLFNAQRRVLDEIDCNSSD